MPEVAAQEEWETEDQNQEGLDTQVEGNDDVAATDDQPSPFDDLAKDMGWKPKAEWKGDPSTHVDAQTYIRTTYEKQRQGADRIKELKAQNAQKQRMADDYAARLERLERTTNSMMSEREQQVRAEMRSQFEAAKRQAAKDGDDDKYDALVQEQLKAERHLEQQFKRDPEPDVQQMAQQMLSDPIVGKFWREHAWVAADENLYNEVFEVAERAARAGKTEPEQIILVKQYLRSEYPERYENVRPRQAAVQLDDDDDDGGQQAARDPTTGQFVPKRDAHIYQQQQPARRPPPNYAPGNGRSAGRLTPEQQAAASLPPEARRVFEQQKKEGRFKGDIVRFAKMYNGELGVLDD